MSGNRELTDDERSLLLFLETQAVDYCGKVGMVHVNADDLEIMTRWRKDGFVQTGRIRSADHLPSDESRGAHCWVRLSDEAWRMAHEERRARADRVWARRTWKTTAEAREDN
jgi:hypothetical protein